MKAKDAFLLSGELVEIGSKKDRTYQLAYVGFLHSVENDEKSFVIIEDPDVTVYVTKPQFRTNTIKKECVDKRECDVYKCKMSRVDEVLYNAINNPGKFKPVYGYIHPKKLLSSPYVYAADIEYGTRLKYAYNKVNGGRSPLGFNVGHLDIETDVTGSDKVILITFMNGNGETYVAVLKEFFTRGMPLDVSSKTEELKKQEEEFINKRKAEFDRLWKKTEREFRGKLNDEVLEIYDKADQVKIHLKVCDTEEMVIRWMFEQIHNCKPDFITVWNLDYDVPYILNRLNFLNIDPTEIFCHPEVPKKWRMCKYHHDKGKKDSHITDLWHWLHCTDYSSWIDSMCLYGRLRKAKGRESSYKLNDIGAKEIGAGKLEFGNDEGHYEMQMRHQVEYSVYNVVDVLILRVMELKNKDVLNMVKLSGDSLPSDFNHESIKLKNSFYVQLDGINMVPGSVGDPLDQPFDKFIDNRGGAVLDPDRSFKSIAVLCLIETDDIGRVSRFVVDLDVKALYPSTDIAMNITRETKLATVLNIDNTQRVGKKIEIDDIRLDPEQVPGLKNIDVNSWFLAAIYVNSNAFRVAKTFNLPSFDEVDTIIREQYPELLTT